MKKYRYLLTLLLFIFMSLACQVLSRGGSSPADVPSSFADFPMTNDAFNILDTGDGTILYYTKMSGDEVMKFYRDEYTSRGYTERESLTQVSDSVFNIVFDGDPSGRAIVVQSVDLGDGSRTVTIRFEGI